MRRTVPAWPHVGQVIKATECNNEGTLGFSYNLEDTDHLTGGANVFNGQNSVLWCNVRDAFPVEIVQMYQNLRSAGTLSYENVERRFEDHQSKWPESIFNEDAWFKYVGPLTDPDDGKQPTTVYLPMAQGSKTEQRKWWLYNRFRYIDSKYNAGDALSDMIQIRGYAKADITVTPYADVYPTIKYGSYLVSRRGSRGTPTLLACPLDNVNDTEIYIYSASQLSSVGDLSPLKVGFADFSMAARLLSVKLGSDAVGYVNNNLTELHVGNNRLLKSIDVSNCAALAGAVDVSGAANVEELYFEGTNVTSVALPVGGMLDTLRLPSTITNLTVRNQMLIRDFSVTGDDYSSITTLRVENCGEGIPMLDILDGIPDGSRVRLVGFTSHADTISDVSTFYDRLDVMSGLDESGNNTARAVVAGTISGLGEVNQRWLDRMTARYPTVDILYETLRTTFVVRFFNGDTLLYTNGIVYDNYTANYSGPTVTHPTDPDRYAFLAWNPTNAYVTDDRDVYATYEDTDSYLLKFLSGSLTEFVDDTADVIRPYALHHRTFDMVRIAATTLEDSALYYLMAPVVELTSRDVVTVKSSTMYNSDVISLIVRSSSMIECRSSTSLGSSPMGYGCGAMYVRDELVDAYHNDNAWSSSTDGKSINVLPLSAYPASDFSTISDSWDDIVDAVNDGSYSERYEVGDTKLLELTDGSWMYMELVAMDTDTLASDGTSKAATTWLAYAISSSVGNHRMNPAFVATETSADGKTSIAGKDGTGSVGGWEKCEMRSYLAEKLLPKFPSGVRNAIKPVVKYSSSFGTDLKLVNNVRTVDSIWLPSRREIYASTSTAYETLGPTYDAQVKDGRRRGARVSSSGALDTSSYWQTRSVYDVTWTSDPGMKTSFCGAYTNVYSLTNITSTETYYPFMVGFCL